MNVTEQSRFGSIFKPWMLPVLLLLAIAAGVVSITQSLSQNSSSPETVFIPDPFPPRMESAAPFLSNGTWMKDLETGILAPDITLEAFQGDDRFQLSSYRGTKPVVLVLGSFTCDLLQARLQKLGEFYLAQRHRAEFAFIGVTEAGHTIPGFEFLFQRRSGAGSEENYQERRRLLQQAREKSNLPLPCFIDARGDEACQAYAAWPARLVVVGLDGRIVRDFGSVVNHVWDWAEVARVLDAEIRREGPLSSAFH